MGGGIFGIGTSGLLTAQKQISTTGHNIANMNTAGYARQVTESSNRLPSYSGAGYIGTGVQIDTTRRYYDEFLEKQIRDSNSQLGKFERFNELASQIDNILANPDAGLTPTLEAFYNALQEANDFPSSVPARSVLLTSANTLVDRFELLQERFIDLNNQTNSNLEDVAAEITARAESIAELNQQIAVQIGAGNGDLPNDTMDKRENLIKEISQLIDVNVVYQDNGAANVFIGSGQSLVLNSTAFAMSVRDGEYTPKNKEIYLTNNNNEINITSQIKGGELQGLLDFKNQVLDPGFNSLGRIAASVSKEMNDQHQLGMTLQQDASGNYQMGGDFFTDLTVAQIALASNQNTGTAVVSVSITDTAVLTTSDYELTYDGTNYNLTRLSDGTVFTGTSEALLNADLAAAAAYPKGPQGIQLSGLAGMASGDSFLVQPTHELSRQIGVDLSDVLDIALASPIVASEQTDIDAGTGNTGVGQNVGTASLTFNPFEAPVTIPASPAAGALPLTARITIDQYDDVANTFVVSGPGITIGSTISYDPNSNSGDSITLPTPFDYMTVSFTGVPDTIDVFYLNNNTSPQDDNRNGLIMANIQSKKTINNGSADFQRAYGLMVADVGTRTHSSEVDLQAQTTLNNQARENRDSLSGVNLDEEASNLLRFQQAYQASAKVITVADDILNTLLSSI